ncbi:MAG: hypothetical protein KatS3mg115_0881 [Candidatus Poribacteria bacterium]|nr:MAG: hypothetical protein KatS3mg115_0881 [Candidatus Poribacteria bacterium]
MQRRRAVLRLITWAVLLIAVAAHAAFEDLWGGARLLGMGGVGVAIAGDADGLWTNPAALTRPSASDQALIEKRHLLTMSYAALYPGLSDGSQLGQFVAGYLLGLGEPQSAGVGWKRTFAAGLYREDVLTLGLSRRIPTGEKDQIGRLSLGLLLRLLQWDLAPIVAPSGDVLEDLTGPVRLDLSLGLAYLLGISEEGQVPVAVAIHHLTTPNVAASADYQELLPVRVVIGIGSERTRTRWGLDVGLSQQTVDVRLGIEQAVVPDRFYARAGFRLEGLALGSNLTLGFGIALSPETRLDYAFWFPIGTVQETWGSHRFGVVYRF